MNLSLRKKLLLGYISIGLIISILMSTILYTKTYNLFYFNFKTHKISILSFVSSFLRGDEHEKLINKESMNTVSYKKYFSVLNEYYNREKNLHYFYTLNFDKVKKKFYYAIDPVIYDKDIIWFESEYFSIHCYMDIEKNLVIEHNYKKYISDFEFKDINSNVYKVKIISQPKSKILEINDVKIFEILLTENNKIMFGSEIIDSKTTFKDLQISNLAGSKFRARLSFTEKNTPGSITGTEYIENSSLLNRFYSIIDKKETIPEISDELIKSSYGEFMVGYSTIQNSKNENIGIIVLEINSREIEEYREKTFLIASIISAISFIMTILIGFFLARYFTRPLEILTNAVNNISSGNLIQIENINSKDEFGKLTFNFNRMIENLKIAYEVQFNLIGEISEINNTLERKVEDRTKKIKIQTLEFEKQIILAKKIQLSLLPEEIPNIDGANIGFKFQPMMSVGGDLLDFQYQDGDSLKLFICDVSGHGVPAAFLATMVKMALQDCYENNLSPVESLLKIRKSLQGKLSGHFISAVFCKIDLVTGEMISANAGHLPILILNNKGECVSILSKGRIISEVIPSNSVELITQLTKGDKIILYTDGIIEAKNKNKEMFGDERLISILKNHSDLNPKMLSNKIFESVIYFSNHLDGNFEDDITILISEFNGKNILY